MPDQHTFEYASVRNTGGRAPSKLLLDVLLPTSEAWSAVQGKARETLPCIVWYHGGGLIQGSRVGNIMPHMRRAVDELGVCIVAVSTLSVFVRLA